MYRRCGLSHGIRTVAVSVFLACTTADAQTAPVSPTPSACPPIAQPPTLQRIQEGLRDHARDRGFLWRISKDGHSSYLYGTIHVGRFEWLFPGPSVTAALRESDTVALEIDFSDPQNLERMRAATTLRPTDTSPALPLALKTRMERQFDAACIPGAAFAPMHPVMQAMTLALLAGRWDGLDPAYGLDLMLTGMARGMRRSIVSLETPELQAKVLLPDGHERVTAMVEHVLAQLEDGRLGRTLARMTSAWERGDLGDIERYDRWCGCVQSEDDRTFLRALNDDRNPGLADGIDALHREGKKVFAAVGSLHMAGPKALPALMRERGYSVERIALGP